MRFNFADSADFIINHADRADFADSADFAVNFINLSSSFFNIYRINS